jgi:hypothetical protein
VLFVTLGALFVCLRFFRLPSGVTCVLVVIALVLYVVSNVVRLRRD